MSNRTRSEVSLGAFAVSPIFLNCLVFAIDCCFVFKCGIFATELRFGCFFSSCVFFAWFSLLICFVSDHFLAKNPGLEGRLISFCFPKGLTTSEVCFMRFKRTNFRFLLSRVAFRSDEKATALIFSCFLVVSG